MTIIKNESDRPFMPKQVSTQFDRVKCGLVTFLALFAYGSIWVWQGIELAEEGYFVTHHWLFINESPHCVYGMRWFSDFVGGAWMWMIGDPGLIGARFGWVLLLATTGLCAYAVVSEVFPPFSSCLVTIASGIIIRQKPLVIISNLVAVCLLLIVCHLILLSQRGQSLSRRRLVQSIAAGFLLGMTFVSHAPAILAIGFPLVPVVVAWLCRRTPSTRNVAVAVTAIGAAVLTLCMLLAWMQSVGHLHEYLATFRGSDLDESYSVAMLIWRNLVDVRKLLKFLVGVAFTLTVFVVAARLGDRNASSSMFMPSVWFLFLLAVVGITVWGLGIFRVLRMLELAVSGGLWIVGLVFFCVEILAVRREPRHLERASLLALGLAIPIVSVAGSNTGLYKLGFGAWILLPVTMLTAPRVISALSQAVTSIRIETKMLRPYVVATIVFVVVMNCCARLVDPYRDLRNRWELTTPIAHPRLQYIYTSSERASKCSEFLREVELRVVPGDSVLAYGAMGLFYYVTKTEPVLDSPTPSSLTRGELTKRLSELGTSRPMPVVVIRALTNPRSYDWGNGPVIPYKGRTPEKLQIIDEAVASLGYHEVWSNGDFAVMTLLGQTKAKKM